MLLMDLQGYPAQMTVKVFGLEVVEEVGEGASSVLHIATYASTRQFLPFGSDATIIEIFRQRAD